MKNVTSFLPVHTSLCRWISAGVFLGLNSFLAAQTTEWTYHKTTDGLHPDGNEQQMLWLTNRARLNPTTEGLFLANSGNTDISFGIRFFQVDSALLTREFAAIAPKPPAAFDNRLYAASLAHSQDLIARDAQDHTGQITRVAAAGFSVASARLSVFSYASSAMAAHGALNIDWGPGGAGGMQAGRGHRVAIMSDQSAFLSNVGFAVVPETNPATEVGDLVFSGAYCSAASTAPDHYNRFLVGTVWTDANANGIYDPGEGLRDVRVQPDRGRFHAITGVAGGWAIPVTSPDTYQLTLTGPSLLAKRSASATVGADSVLVDFKITPGVTPIVLEYRREANGNLLLSWSGGLPPYQVQFSVDPAADWRNLGTATTVSRLEVTPSGPRGFYRVVSSE